MSKYSYKKLLDIKRASSGLAKLKEKDRNDFLQILSTILWKKRQNIYSANKMDIIRGKQKNLSSAYVHRLNLDEVKLKNIIERLRKLQQLDCGVGKVISEKVLENRIILQKLRVPIGVILVIFESRPEVLLDAAALCIKSGNAVILKGGKDALNTYKVLYQYILEALKKSGISENSVSFLDEIKRKEIYSLLKQKDLIDLVIARGGYEMVKSICENSLIPILSHSAGGARIYVDESADLKMSKNIIINSKISSPATCNSLDTIVVHEKIVAKFMPIIIKELKDYDINIHQENDTNIWQKEFLGMEVAIKIVRNSDEAIQFIENYGKNHTEGIIASNNDVINKFIQEIDAASIMINCSTRLHDGGIYGLGTELGIAIGKLHARGPVGLSELTSYKWIAYGKGQIRN